MNPFLINNYISPEYFCDRESETKTLISNISNQANTAFFAQRRIGKTALIHHVFHLLRKKKITCIYIDIFATQNLKEFTDILANGIYKVFPENKSLGKRFLEAIKLLRPVISIDEMSGNPELSLDITQPRQFEKTISHLLSFLDRQKTKTVIAIDEFQQILNYPEKNVEALLRTAVQTLKNVNFIFCGSNRKMMHNIFNNAKRPFYASSKSLNLQKIDKKPYLDFIRKHFTEKKFRISEAVIESILDLTDGHTYFTQFLCHEIFLENQKIITNEEVLRILNKILKENEGTYFQYRSLLTTAQWNLLKAISSEEKVEKPFAQYFIQRYGLGSPGNVQRTLKSLADKEMIFYNNAVENPYYELQDKFLMRWLQQK